MAARRKRRRRFSSRSPRFKITAKTVLFLTSIAMVIAILGIIFFSQSNEKSIIDISLLILSITNLISSIFIQGIFTWFILEDRRRIGEILKIKYTSKDPMVYIVMGIMSISIITIVLKIISIIF